MNLQIRNMKSDDFTDLYRLLSDSDVMRFLEPPFSKEQTSSFLKSAGLSESPLIYAVEAGETFIGYVIFHDYDDRSIEIGWVLFPDYWGKGYATQLTAQMIEKAKELGIYKLDEPPIGDARRGEQGKKYYTEYNGANYEIDCHIKKGVGEAQYCLRIYYFWHKDDSITVIADLPWHLDTRDT